MPAPYTPSTFTNLLQRYEEPNGMTRWDSPLFTVPFDDPMPPTDAIIGALLGSNTKPAPVVRPNLATVAPPMSSADALYVLDRATAGVVREIQNFLAERSGGIGGVEGGVVQIGTSSTSTASASNTSPSNSRAPNPDNNNNDDDEGGGGEGGGERGTASQVHLPSVGTVSVAQLQRLRRQFVGLYRSRGVGMGAATSQGTGALGEVQEAAIVRAFVAFLNGVFQGGEEG
jgi:tRNA uridine 5-carbamoylmethylation protein Kti12